MQLEIDLSPHRPKKRPAAFPTLTLTSTNAVSLGVTATFIVVAVVGSFWSAAKLHTDEGGVLHLAVGLAAALAILTHPSSFQDRWLWSVRGVFLGKAAFFAFILAGLLLAAAGATRLKLRAEDIAVCRTAFLSADNSHRRVAALQIVPRHDMSQALQVLADWQPTTCGRLRETGAF